LQRPSRAKPRFGLSDEESEFVPTKTIEPATLENFSEEGYLMANPDVAASAKQYRHTGKHHFDVHGCKENRRQFTERFVYSLKEGGKQKYERFKPVLRPDVNFRWLAEENSFPIASSQEHFSRGEYKAGESANSGFHHFLVDMTENANGLFLDIGSGLRDEIYDNCLYLEVYPSVTTDIVVAPDCYYPFRDNSFDGICCAAVLEHVTKPWQVVSEIYRMLKPGGRCYIDWPFLQPVHGYPSHYYNATREGLRIMFERFEIEQIFSHDFQSPEYSLYWIMGRFTDQIADPKLHDEFCSMTIGEVLSHRPDDANFWKPILKTLPQSALEELACGNCLIGRKPRTDL
jgi:SAM-dependent methyltransferase